MKKLLLCLVLAVSTPVFAETPTDASLKELLVVSDVQGMMDKTLEQMDGYMKTAMLETLKGKEVTPEMQQQMESNSKKIAQIFKVEMGWDKMEPLFLDIYKKSFSQSDVDGMIQFYKTPAGQSVIQKMPLVMQNSMEVMQQRMTAIMPKIIQATEESMQDMKAKQSAGEAKPAAKSKK